MGSVPRRPALYSWLGAADMLTRSPMKRAKPIEGQKPPRMRKCAAKGCQNRFTPRSIAHKACGNLDCAVAIVEADNEKKRRHAIKADRAKDAAKRDAIMPHKKRLAAFQRIFNRYVNLVNRGRPCISCDKPYMEGITRHASHFKSVGSNSALRFHLWNVHTSCHKCNLFLSGNIGEYEPRLRIKIGSDKVEFLNNHPRSREYSVEWLKRATKIFNRKINRLKKRVAI